MPRNLCDRLQRYSIDRSIVDIDNVTDPAADPATMQFDSNNGSNSNRSEARRNTQIVRNEVVETFVEPGDVGQDASDAAVHTVPGTVRPAIAIRLRQQP